MLFKTDEKARAEHNAVRNNAGWYRWTHDLVEVCGVDATEFLDSLYVNSIAQAPVGCSKYTAMLNHEGHIIDDVIVTRMEEDKYWVSTLYAPQLLLWIDEHKGTCKVSSMNLTSDIDMYAIQGPRSLDMMNVLITSPIDALARFEMANNTVGDITVRVHRGGFTGERGYEIYCDCADTKEVAEAIRSAGESFNATEMSILEVYVRSLPMEKGLALKQDMCGLTPYEAGLGWSVDLSKEFIGKEALKRAQQEGLQRKLVGLELEAESYEDINQSERIYLRGRDIGQIKAGIYGYTIEKNIGFAVVDARYTQPGTRVEIGSHNSPAIIVNKHWI